MGDLLKGKTALVTGSSSGIGAAIAKRFAQEGADVIAACHGNKEGAEKVVKAIDDHGGHAEFVQADLSCEESVVQMFSDIKERHRTLDILVNNAGRTFNIPFADISENSIEKDVGANLVPAMLCSKYAASMLSDGGCIINTASIRGFYKSGRTGIMGYCAAKAGVISFTENLALELAPRIRVNAVAPGFVMTDYLSDITPDAMKEEWLCHIPLKRFVDVQNLAGVYLFLAVEKEMTGAVIPVDGGYTILDR